MPTSSLHSLLIFYFPYLHPFLSLPLTTPFLTLDEVQLCQEFKFFGDIQLEVSEGWISSQGEMLEILNCFTQPGAMKNRESRVKRIKEDACLHDASVELHGRTRQTNEQGVVCDHF